MSLVYRDIYVCLCFRWCSCGIKECLLRSIKKKMAVISVDKYILINVVSMASTFKIIAIYLTLSDVTILNYELLLNYKISLNLNCFAYNPLIILFFSCAMQFK